MRVRRLTTLAALSAAAMLVGMAAPASAQAQAPGNEHIALTFRLPTSSLIGRAVATGLVKGTGTVHDGVPLTVSLPSGDLLIEPDNALSATLNRRTCVAQLTGVGTVQVTGGTGAFAGAGGDGTDTLQATLVYPRNPDRSCNLFASPRGVITLHANLNLTLG